MRLCAQYLLAEKRGNLALDPVGKLKKKVANMPKADPIKFLLSQFFSYPAANFHLRNGACAHQLNWMADTSGM